jgi:hypothetical protein
MIAWSNIVMNQTERRPAQSARRTRRKRVLMKGVIADASGTYLFDCTFLDVSEDGARIRLPDKCELPAIYFLVNVPARLGYEALTVWRNSGKVGVRFARVIPVTGGTDPSLAFLRRLWLRAAAG